jgi:c-di-AMP phosphodiesterase-like protein
MAKAMKVPVLIFEHKDEVEWLIEGLSIVLDKREDKAHKTVKKDNLMEELKKIKNKYSYIGTNIHT